MVFPYSVHRKTLREQIRHRLLNFELDIRFGPEVYPVSKHHPHPVMQQILRWRERALHFAQQLFQDSIDGNTLPADRSERSATLCPLSHHPRQQLQSVDTI